MPLINIQVIKNWFTNTRTREENWDELNRELNGFGTRTNNNLKQIGLDLNGNSYDFNNQGKSTQATSIISRITTLESQGAIVGTRNLGLDISDPAKISIRGSDGSNLSPTNPGQVSFNSTTIPGEIITRNIIANVSITMTGSSWGFDGNGDLTAFPLWIVFFDTGSDVILGVAAQGGRSEISNADTDTLVGNMTTFQKVLVSAPVTSPNNITYLGYVITNFDDTGNPGGENYWAIQNGVGDVNIGYVQTLFFGEVRF